MPNLRSTIRGFVKGLPAIFPKLYARDPRRFWNQVERFTSKAVPRFGRGRPPLEDVTRAAALRAEGKPWREIYSVVIPDLSRLPGREASAMKELLRNRVRARRSLRRARGG